MIRLRDLAKPFLKVGTFGFGGGAGMLAMLRNECVKKMCWLTDNELAIAVAMGQMLPGPFVPNYCEYIGYRLRGTKGAIVAATALLLPSFILMILLSWFYLSFQTLPGMNQIFKGVGAVMTAIIIWAGYDMAKILLKATKDFIIFGFALFLFLMKFDPFLTVLLCGGLKILFDNVKSKNLFVLVPLFLFDFKKAVELFAIFFKIGAVIFGGGYAAIPFIQNEVCNLRPWLTPKEFLDGVALGQITPGPIAITATFVGFKVMGIPGALVSTIGVFLPSFLMLLILIKIYNRISNNRFIISFFSGIKAAVVAMLFSIGIFFIVLNWANIAYGVLGVCALLVLILVRVDPILLILVGVVFSLIVR